MSLTADCNHDAVSAAIAGYAQRIGGDRPPLNRGNSSPLPPRPRSGRRASEGPIDEFPYSPAFAYPASGKEVAHFPCGSEAVMINSALALEAFKCLEEV